VKSNGSLSEMRGIKRGVRQEDSLSQFLFNLVLNEIIKEVTFKREHKIGDQM
jgi:hypothetical protein